jgi:hypothetical protein
MPTTENLRHVAENRNSAGNGKSGHGKPVYWPQDALARAADAIQAAHSNDSIVLARAALEAGIRGADDVQALMDAQPKPQPLKPRAGERDRGYGLAAFRLAY